MDTEVVGTPFGPDVPERPLAAAPLVQVVSQIRFPPIASINNESFIGPFQEAIRKSYPVLRKDTEAGILLTAQEIKSSSSATVWRFTGDDAAGWQVSLSSGFVALQVPRYTSRREFLGRLRQVVEAAHSAFHPASYDRLGVRYIDRFEQESQARMRHLVRPDVAGIVGQPLGSQKASLTHSVTDSVFALGAGDTLRARWGWLPANATIDPTLEPAKTPSWILDLDMYREQSRPFEVEGILRNAEAYAKRIYRFFRWAVTPAMLDQYAQPKPGGKVRD